MFSDLFAYLGRNKAGVALIGTGIGLLTLVALVGCGGLGDVVKVRVPQRIEDATQSGDKVSLNRAPFVREEYVQNVERAVAEFDANIENAEAWRSFFADLANTGLTIGQDAAANSGIPMGGALALALGGLGGLIIEKPGSRRKAAEQAKAAEDRGYDMGRTEAAALLTGSVGVAADMATRRGV